MFISQMESLERRAMFSVTAAFIPAARILTVFGDAQNNNIVISRNAAGSLLVNGGAVHVLGGNPTVANTSLITVFGQDGNDTITLDESSGALPVADLFGGAGNDQLTGGSGNDLIFGEAGNDILLGKGGDDLLFGGADNDILTGGVGNDQVFGEAGNDRMIWNPGEGTDLNEGGAGIDTVEVNGGNGAESFTATPNGTRVRFDRISPAPFSLDIGTTESLVLNMNGGDDTFVGANGLAPLISLTVDGGTGNDSITGGDGNDTLLGGDGNDLVIGGRGNDTALLGAGNDTFVWNPGDASDTVEGQDGSDTLQFNGANINENINISANGTRLRFTRDVAAIAMDVNGTENVNFAALGGADTITVGDLTGTGVTAVNLDLASPAGSGTGDGAADTVIVNGTQNNDTINVLGQGTSYSVIGLPATVSVTGSEGANDSLVVNGLGGNDGLGAQSLPAGVVHQLTLDAGAGDDSIIGSAGADLLLGGDGSDIIVGGQGNDTALMGAGSDAFVWNPGDGSDTIDGQDGTDSLLFNGANVAENIDLSANGNRLRFTRDVAGITMDVGTTEIVTFNALGGADNINVNDLTGTGVTRVNLNLGSNLGTPDGSVDTVTVNGTAANDNIQVSGNTNNGVSIRGLSAAVFITNTDSIDALTVNALGGDDTVNASQFQPGVVSLTQNGGDGNDTLIGSQGDDLVIGGRGNDTALLGDGDDSFVWNPGDGSDTVEGQGGFNTLVFNGANVNENVDLSANGTRVRLFRDVANITMDLNGIQNVSVTTLGGVDNVTVNDLTGTDVTQVSIDLGATGGAGDGSADSVTVDGSAGNDVATVAGDGATGLSILGLFSTVTITHAEPMDRLNVNTVGGDDVVEASGLDANTISLTANGGDGDDVLIGSPGKDTLQGGIGDDILIGNGGGDVLDGGPGENVLIA